MIDQFTFFDSYMFSLNPEINRAPFTVEEDCILMAAIKEYGINYREFPANLLPGRNMRQIRERYNNVLKHVNTREHWTEDHDIKLMELVEEFGISDWVKISDKMVSHTRTSCRQRYTTIKKFLDKHPNKTVSDVPRRKRGFSTNVTTDNWMEAIIESKQFQSMNEYGSEDESENVQSTSAVSSKQLVPKSLIHNPAYYDFLKYSFNFKFGDTIIGSDALFENVQIACQLLQASPLPIQINAHDPSFSCYVTMQNPCKKVQLEPDLLRSLNQLGQNDFNYPVNFNTILGMRGMTAMFMLDNELKQSPIKRKRKKVPVKKITTEQLQTIKSEPNAWNEHDALNLFKMRFKSVFKQTAKLAKMQRAVTSVSLRLRNQKHQILQSVAPSTSTTIDFDNNETVVRVATDEPENDDQCVSENEEKPNKRSRITVLESITLGLNEQHAIDPLQLPSTSTAIEPLRYRVQLSDRISVTNIKPCKNDNECMTDDQNTNSNTDFVIWTAVSVNDEANASIKHPTQN